MATYTVKSSAELSSVLKGVKNGDVVQLAAGDYSNVKIDKINIAGNVTITSANVNNKAVLADLTVSASSGLTIKNLDLYTTVDNKAVYGVYGSKNITFDGIEVHGKEGLGSATLTSAFMVRNNTDVTIKNSEFHDLFSGINMLDNTGLTIENNYIHHVRIDAIRGGGNSNLLIKSNLITDFLPVPGDHPDGIQLWTRNTKGSAENITIADNLIIRGDGAPSQGIFINDDNLTMPFKNLSITGNLIVGQSYRGISVASAENLKLANNTVLAFEDRISWISVDRAPGAVVENNVATTFKVAGVDPEKDSNDLGLEVTDKGAKAVNDWLASRPNFNGGWGTASQYLADAGITYTAAMAAADAAKSSYFLVDGTAGNDTLRVRTGFDSRLQGGAGNDLLIGSPTRKTELVGGVGDDTYYVNGTGDKVIELANEGTDRVHTAIDYTLTANVENLRLTGIGLTGTGNELGNQIWGSSGNDRIYGMGGNDLIRADVGNDSVWGGDGADTIYGDGGDDAIYGDADSDKLYGGEGNDRIWGGTGDDQIEGGAGNDQIWGDDGNDTLRGNEGDDILNGGASDDTVIGGAGSDRMTGGAGKDTFWFYAGDVSMTAVDTITDFKTGEDKISLRSLDAKVATAVDDAFGFIGTKAFGNVAGQLRYETVGTTSTVYGDTNGDGVADFKIVVEGVKVLQAGDFIL